MGGRGSRESLILTRIVHVGSALECRNKFYQNMYVETVENPKYVETVENSIFGDTSRS